MTNLGGSISTKTYDLDFTTLFIFRFRYLSNRLIVEQRVLDSYGMTNLGGSISTKTCNLQRIPYLVFDSAENLILYEQRVIDSYGMKNLCGSISTETYILQLITFFHI